MGGGKGKKPAAKAGTAFEKKLEKKVNKLEKLDAPEVKEVGTVFSNPVDYNGQISEIMNIAQGLTSTTRIGDQVFLRRLKLRQKMSLASAQVDNCMRTIVFLDTLNTGVAPILTDVLNTVGTAMAPISAFNLVDSETKRFHILYDSTHTLSSGINNYHHEKIIKVNKKLHYAGPNTTDGLKNRCYVCTLSDGFGATSPVSKWTCFAEYTDV